MLCHGWSWVAAKDVLQTIDGVAADEPVRKAQQAGDAGLWTKASAPTGPPQGRPRTGSAVSLSGALSSWTVNTEWWRRQGDQGKFAD